MRVPSPSGWEADGVPVSRDNRGREADPDTRAEVANRGFAYRTGPPTAGLPDFYMLAMHSETYVRSRWTRYLEFVELRERYVHGAHDAAVLRRRAD